MKMWIIVVSVLLLGVLYFLVANKKKYEAFGNFYNIQNDYTTSQRTLFHDVLPNAIFTNENINLVPTDINKALTQPDVFLNTSPDRDYSVFFQEDNNQFSKADYELCRGAKHPRNLKRGNMDKIGCGWWFRENGTSVGALGRLKGPIDPNLGKDFPGGQWIWNLNEAAKKEDIKICKQVTTCDAIGAYAGQCGFCDERGYAIPVDTAGNPKYPDDDGGNCGEALILNTFACPKPPVAPLDGTGEEEVEYDPVNGLPIVRSTPAALLTGSSTTVRARCDPDARGNLGIDCLLSLTVGYTDDSRIRKLLRSRSAPTQDDVAAMNILRSIGLQIPAAVLGAGNIDKESAAVIYKKILDFASDPRRKVSESAKYLALGNPNFTPCMFEDADFGPFPVSCMQQEFRKAGCQAAGEASPNDDNAGAYNAYNWGDLKGTFKSLFDSTKNTKEPALQQQAIKDCLGFELYRKKPEICDEPGLEYLVYTRAADGSKGHFIGRTISKTGLLPTTKRYWWEDSSTLAALLDKVPGRAANYSIRTFISTKTPITFTTEGWLPTGGNGGRVLVNNVTQPTTGEANWGNTWKRVAVTINGGPRRNRVEFLFGAVTNTKDVGGFDTWTVPSTSLGMFQLKHDSWRPVIALDFFRGSLTDNNEVISLSRNENVTMGKVGGKTGASFAKGGMLAFDTGFHSDNLQTITFMVYQTQIGDVDGIFTASTNNMTASQKFSVGTPQNSLQVGYVSATNGAVNNIFTARGSTTQSFAIGNPLNKWTHYAVVFSKDRTFATLYVNGLVAGTVVSQQGRPISKSLFENVMIGSESFEGSIAWVHIYSEPLTTQQVIRDMNYDNPNYVMPEVPLPDVSLTQGCKLTTENDMDHVGGDYSAMKMEGDSETDNLQQCQAECCGDPKCLAYTFNSATNMCYLKNQLNTPVTGAGANATTGLMMDKNAYIRNRVGANMCVDVRGGDMGDNATVHSWGIWGGANQKWKVNYDGRSQQMTFKSFNSGKCLDVTGADQVVQNTCSPNAASQKWSMDSQNRLHPGHSQTKCLVSTGINTASGRNEGPQVNGSRYAIEPCNSSDRQKFDIQSEKTYPF